MTNHPEPVPATNQADGASYASGQTIAVDACGPVSVPATNQAGEVERERVARIVYDWTPRIRSFEEARSGDLADAYRHADEVITALATQPATSQEGGSCICGGAYTMCADRHAINCPASNQRDAYRAMIAATPTPLTLSADLRGCLEEVETLLTPPGNAWSGSEPKWQTDAYGKVRAALASAQVQP